MHKYAKDLKRGDRIIAETGEIGTVTGVSMGFTPGSRIIDFTKTVYGKCIDCWSNVKAFTEIEVATKGDRTNG